MVCNMRAAAPECQCLPGARTVNWDHGLIDRHTPRRSRLIAVLVALGRDTYGFDDDPSPPPKLVTLRLTDQRSGAFVLVAKDQSPLFQIVGLCDHVQVIAATGGTTSWAAAKEATATIPIVLQGRWRPRQVRFSGQLQPAWRQRNGGRQSMINEISHHCWRDCIRSLPTGIRPGRFGLRQNQSL